LLGYNSATTESLMNLQPDTSAAKAQTTASTTQTTASTTQTTASTTHTTTPTTRVPAMTTNEADHIFTTGAHTTKSSRYTTMEIVSPTTANPFIKDPGLVHITLVK
jgi:hypothetical protein